MGGTDAILSEETAEWASDEDVSCVLFTWPGSAMAEKWGSKFCESLSEETLKGKAKDHSSVLVVRPLVSWVK